MFFAKFVLVLNILSKEQSFRKLEVLRSSPLNPTLPSLIIGIKPAALNNKKEVVGKGLVTHSHTSCFTPFSPPAMKAGI